MDKPAASGKVVIRKAYADTPNGQLHYHYSHPPAGFAGSERLPILLLHMSASSSKCFLPMMSQLSSLGFYCLAPDMPGFGSSYDPAANPPSISWYADLYYKTLSGLPEFSSGCHIIGHHSGGVIGTELASKHHNFCKSLTCIGPTVMSLEERVEMSKTFLDPFNRPVASGDHLFATWKYLRWEGIPEAELDLMQREALDHIRAWRGRSQIYSCVWAYDLAEAMKLIDPGCLVLGLCAKDDVLWPYFESFKKVGGDQVQSQEILGGNFGPDLDSEGIVKAFLTLIQ